MRWVWDVQGNKINMSKIDRLFVKEVNAQFVVKADSGGVVLDLKSFPSMVEAVYFIDKVTENKIETTIDKVIDIGLPYFLKWKAKNQ